MKRKILILFISIITVYSTIYLSKLIYKDYKEKEINLEVNLSSKSNIMIESEAKKELEKIIQEIRDLGFEVDEENETVSVLKHIEGKDKIRKSGHYTFYELLNMKKFKEIRKYNKNYKILLQNPLGEDFVINPEYDAKLNYFTYRSSLTTDTLKGVPINIVFYFSEEYFKVFLQILENNIMDDFVYRYKTNDVTNAELSIDYDAETGKKIKVNYLSDVWEESEK
jgi:hypothetical protein